MICHRRGTLTLEAALVLPPVLMLVAFLVLAIRYDLQKLVLAEALDQTAAEMALIVPLQEAGRDLMPDLSEDLGSFILSLAERTGDWAQSTLLETTVDRRIDYWLHEPSFLSGLSAGLAYPLQVNPSVFDDRTIELSENQALGVILITCTWRRTILGVPMISSLESAIPAWPLAASIESQSEAKDNPGDVWLLDNFSRGRMLRKVFWANLPQDFPVIARWSGGEAVKTHSLDVTAPTYQNPENILDTVKDLLQRLAEFDGASYEREEEQIVINGEEIIRRRLLLIIPENEDEALTGPAWQELAALARAMGIQFQLERYGTSTRFEKDAE